MNNDLDYVYIAPVSYWRAGRFYTTGECIAPAVLQLGHIDLPALPPLTPATPQINSLPSKIDCDTMPSVTKRINIPAIVKRVNRMRPPRE